MAKTKSPEGLAPGIADRAKSVPKAEPTDARSLQQRIVEVGRTGVVHFYQRLNAIVQDKTIERERPEFWAACGRELSLRTVGSPPKAPEERIDDGTNQILAVIDRATINILNQSAERIAGIAPDGEPVEANAAEAGAIAHTSEDSRSQQ